ncbi:hypothetical protein C8J57DRAFT_1480453 [Mycena rebaudengoi]|nr:hypothetical protein C8J57DRAFT_1480453 [Mycena rebaudengoi]
MSEGYFMHPSETIIASRNNWTPEPLVMFRLWPKAKKPRLFGFGTAAGPKPGQNYGFESALAWPRILPGQSQNLASPPCHRLPKIHGFCIRKTVTEPAMRRYEAL